MTRYLSMVILSVFLTACGAGSTGSHPAAGNNNDNPGNGNGQAQTKWDEMKWDQGKWQ